MKTSGIRSPRTPSIVRGALAGLIGGLAGAAAKATAERGFPAMVAAQDFPPLLLGERAGTQTRQPPPESPKTAAVTEIQWGLGGLAGAVYGAVVELNPGTAAWQGAAFGMALHRVTHEGALPMMGLSSPANDQSQRATYVIYGVVTELVRRLVRSGL